LDRAAHTKCSPVENLWIIKFRNILQTEISAASEMKISKKKKQ
jgi:hypothetical protein